MITITENKFKSFVAVGEIFLELRENEDIQTL